MRGLAKGSLDLPFCLSVMVHSGMGIKLLVEQGNDSQKKQYLNAALAGTCLIGIANTEETGGTDIKSIRSKLEVASPDEAYGHLSVHKNCASNVSDSDLIMASVWKLVGDAKPLMEIMLLDRSMITQTPLNDSLLGFRTGQTGSLASKDLSVAIRDIQLGPDLTGYSMLKFMFNLDRLWVGAMVAGVLEGVFELAVSHIKERSSFGKPLAEYQYIQQKLVDIYTAHITLWGIIHKIVHSGDAHGPSSSDLGAFSDELSVLKISAIDDGLKACLSFFELFGCQSYMSKSLPAKLLQDILAFKFLGGSKEQQKILLFDSLCAKYAV
jgi:alkylation response protein AidB-like acyl-CoA dehydrogenase